MNESPIVKGAGEGSDGAVEIRSGSVPRIKSAIGRIRVTVQVVLGVVRMSVHEMSALEHGAVISLDRRIGEPVDILVNGRAIGRGEIAVKEQDQERFAVSITELFDAAAPDQEEP